MSEETKKDDARATSAGDDPGFSRVLSFVVYGLSLPERAVRSTSAVVGGAVRESAALMVPEAFRSSKTYSMFVEQMLDFVIEDVGGVESDDPDEDAGDSVGWHRCGEHRPDE